MVKKEPTAFGIALKKSRMNKGLTLKELDRKSGISYVAISNLERGKNNPNILTAKKLSNALEDKELFNMLIK